MVSLASFTTGAVTSLIMGGSTTLTDDQLDDLHGRGIEITEAAVTAYESQGGELSALHLSDGKRLARHAVFMRPPISLRGDLHEQLGCILSDDSFQVVVNEIGQTSVPGVYAAGDMVSPMPEVSMAAASGGRRGVEPRVRDGDSKPKLARGRGHLGDSVVRLQRLASLVLDASLSPFSSA